MAENRLDKTEKLLLPLLIEGKIELEDLSEGRAITLIETESFPEELLKYVFEKTNWRLNVAAINNPKFENRVFWPYLKRFGIAHFLVDSERKFNSKEIGDLYRLTANQARYNLIKRPDVPLEFLKTIVKKGNIAEIERVAENPNCSNELLRSLVKLNNFRVTLNVAKADNLDEITLRQLYNSSSYPGRKTAIKEVIAERKDLPKDLIADILKTQDQKVILALSRNSNLNEETALEIFRKGEGLTTKRQVLRNGQFSYEIFQEIATLPKKTYRESLFCNPRLPNDIRLRMAVEPGIDDYAKKNMHWSDAQKLLPVESVSRENYEGVYEERNSRGAGNVELNSEILKFSRSEKKNVIHFFSPLIEKELISQISRKTKIDLNRSLWAGWRPAGENAWIGIVELINDKKKVIHSLLKVELPNSIDGFVYFGRDNKDRKIFYGRTSIIGEKREQIWWCQGEEGIELNKVEFPEFKENGSFGWRYGKKNTIETKLIGTVIFNGGMFALWEHEGEVVGWTQESEASKIGEKRILGIKDLAPSFILGDRMQVLEYLVRGILSEEISL